MQSNPVLIGPFGSDKGRKVRMQPKPQRLQKLDVWIDSDQKWVNGVTIKSNGAEFKFGNTDAGTKKTLFDLDADPTDYVVEIFGRTGSTYVNCLGVKCFKGSDSLFGKDEGEKFSIPVTDGGAVAGLFGRADDAAVTAVGAYVVTP
ncbi:hypothetical protein E2562_016586 [Oryza meyeriana var. granulata]|uniref:Jacalin-type lectin domain-containing protein n=1 Tax=Oryza meyeriana var. granulata TaxID=110450 RepID=A0A6G1C5X0_9ORYZ|nr:hypothetical protein E2562_016586 [Oryza meyeriana var. granulata]